MIEIGNFFSIPAALLAAVLIAGSPLANAGKVKVEASVEDETVLVGDPFIYQVSISTEGNVETQDPILPDMDGVEIQGTSTSSSFTSRLMPGPNGMVFEKSRVLAYNYQLVAKKTGLLKIGPSRVQVDGQTYQTNSIQVDITDNPGRVAPRQQGGQQYPGFSFPNIVEDEEEDLYSQLLRRRQNVQQDEPAYKSLPKNANEAFFVTVELDKTEAYEGEQVFANWYLYTRGEISQLDRLKFPDLKGFWKEDVEAAPNLLFQQEIVNGVPYKKALLASHAIFPIKAGIAVVDEYKIRATVSLPTLAYGLLGRPFQYTRSSDRVKVNVKPLPMENKPLDFTGAVGTYEVTTQIDKTTGQVGQPISLKIRFEGEGNAKLIELPELKLPEALEVYDSRSESKFFKSGKGFKEFEVLIMPKQEGQIQIPELTFSYFDPGTKKYTVKRTSPISLTIAPGQLQAGKDSQMKLEPQKVKEVLKLPGLIHEYKSGASLMSFHWKVWALIYAGILLAILLRFAFLFEIFRREAGLKDHFEKKLKIIKEELKKGNYRKVGAEGINAMNLVLGQISELGGSSQDLNKILLALNPSVRRELGSELKELGDLLQTLCFAPEAMVGSLKEKDNLTAMVKKLEKALLKALALSGETEGES